MIYDADGRFIAEVPPRKEAQWTAAVPGSNREIMIDRVCDYIGR